MKAVRRLWMAGISLHLALLIAGCFLLWPTGKINQLKYLAGDPSLGDVFITGVRRVFVGDKRREFINITLYSSSLVTLPSSNIKIAANDRKNHITPLLNLMIFT